MYQTRFAKKNSLKAEKKKTKETRSYDIRDMFRRQNGIDSQRLSAADKDPEMTVID